jgi:hypothetical protein
MTRTRLLLTIAFAAATIGLTAATTTQAAVTIESFTAETSSTLAGARSDATTSFAFSTAYSESDFRLQPIGGIPREVVVTTPPGLVGDPNNVPFCPRALFQDRTIARFQGGCPANSQVGVATLHFSVDTADHAEEATLGVYNVQPGPGEPALLGIQGFVNAVGVIVPILLTTGPESGYALTATIGGIPQAPLLQSTLASQLTLWGVPAAHVRAEGSSDATEGRLNGPIPAAPPAERKPFMENPTDCGETPSTTLEVNTYEEPDVNAGASTLSPAPTECGGVPFAPTVAVTPESAQAGAPTGLDVQLTVPQSNDAQGRGTAALERAVVSLPAGMGVSPSAASTLLEGCTDAQFGAGSDAPAECPAGSVIGSDEVESPLLPEGPGGEEGKLTGKVFLGQPLSTDPTSGQMFRVFQELQGHGLDVKLPGSVVANPVTGQLTATFEKLPELPFQTFRLHLRGGPNAVLVNPQSCGPQTTTTELFPYSDPTVPATPSSTFVTSYDGAGAPCPPVLPFAPAAAVSSVSSQAGALSPASFTFSRGDESQPLGRIEAKLPPGLLGYVSKVQLCEPAQAEAGTCASESRVGTVSTTAGAGGDPLTVEGSVYLAHGSDGYPFMLSVVVPAVAGPYDLGDVVVPVWLQVNSDGSITAVSGSLPSILDGIPLDIRSITMTLDRPGFMSNPTGCNPLSLTGQATSLSGTLAALSAPFQATGCSSLPFTPSFTVATQGSTSKLDGASLTVRVSQPAGEANIRYVRVQLPKSLPSRLTTLQQACTEAKFAANPAGCPPGSVVGTATAYTPMLLTPLSGPAILVSHGGRAFPDLDVLLQGDGVTIDLVGNTDIKNGVTTSTFASVPDAPISGFELNLPEGPYSALGANGNLCQQTLTMPTTITAQNNTSIQQNTPINITSCPTSKPSIKIVKTKAKIASLIVVVHTTAAGAIHITGAGLRPKTKINAKAGGTAIDLPLTSVGRTMRIERAQLKLRVSLTVGKQIVVAKTTSVKL